MCKAANSRLFGSVGRVLLVWFALRDLGDSGHSCLISGYLQSRLQTYAGTFGKPQGTVTRVHAGPVIMSKLQNKEHMIQALSRAKFKFPGGWQIHIFKEWGFTEFNVDGFKDTMAEKPPRWLWGQIQPQRRPSEQMVCPALWRTLAMPPLEAAPSINLSPFLSKNNKLIDR